MRFVGIDPSTKTGLVIMDEQQQVLVQTEIKTKHKVDPQRFMDIAGQVISYLQPSDVICIEGFSYGSKGSAVSTQYGVGWLIRSVLVNKRFPYQEVTPSMLKKFATGKGNTKKEDMVLPIFKRWDFEHPSDNVRDAYVLAQIARSIKNNANLTAFQKDVMANIS